MIYFSNIVSVVLQLYIAYSLFSYLLGDKTFKRPIQWGFYGVICVLKSLASIYVDKSTFFLPVILLGSMFAMSLTFKGQMFSKFILSMLLTVIFGLCEIFSGMLMISLTHLDMKTITTSNHTLYLFGVLLSNVLAFLVVKFIGNIKHTAKVKLSFSVLLGLFLTSIASLSPIYIISKFTYELVGLQNALSVLVVTVILIASNLVMFHLYETHLKHEYEKTEYAFISRQFNVQAEYYKKLADEQDTVNKTIHDIKNTLLGIQGCITSGDYGGAVRRISEICENLNNRSKIYTSNIVVDTILNAKQKEAKNEGCDFEIFASSFEGGKIDAIDLGIILGNALDNAIEACKKIPKAKGREIYAKIFRIDDYVSIVIENSVDKPVEIVDGTIVSTKQGAFHGYGIKNIKALVEKYDGDVHLHYDTNKFSISMLLKSS